ncbi:hypothetical protein [Macrococcus equipercicus]|uniref:Uncharacterized protein n=1 Tax=Macrococcus equipercicus TaxID=69967 RepID=A0A9Q9F1B9_9STAP|nr:hypothetical protein [Macrococcus equipercicus]UTH13630.1 hypothetical protein KFV11_10465 [Macrococcus equipercicus]
MLIIVLAGCSDDRKIVAEPKDTKPQPQTMTKTELIHLTAAAKNRPAVTADNWTVQDIEYRQVTFYYIAEIDEVIKEMSPDLTTKTATAYFKTMKANIAAYNEKQSKLQTSSRMTEVKGNVGAANANYLSALDKVVTGLQTKDDALKEEGFSQFVSAHTYLNAAIYELADAPSEETTAPLSEQPVIKETYTLDDSTK